MPIVAPQTAHDVDNTPVALEITCDVDDTDKRVEETNVPTERESI